METGHESTLHAETQTETTHAFSKSCMFPSGDAATERLCDFCFTKFHIQCAGLEKPPAKTKSWICSSCRSIPATLQATTERLLKALEKIDRLEQELEELIAEVLGTESRGKLTYSMIYEDIKGQVPCIRRMNATHQIGCSSGLSGNTGVVHLIEEDEHITWLTTHGPHAPYIAVFTAEMFTRPNIEKLVQSGKVNGMVVDYSNDTRNSIIDTSKGYSTDRSCPNDNFGLYAGTDYANCSEGDWNPAGDGLNFDYDFGMPVFVLLREADFVFIEECYSVNNHPNGTEPAEYPLCALELMDFMHGVKDTPTCMWRTQRTTNLEGSHYCDPIGDKNVWGFAKNSDDAGNYKAVIIAAAQLDATSLFYSQRPPFYGAEQVVSSIVPLLGAAEAIGKLSAEEKGTWDHDIMFTFFNAESYDYTGSSRMAYDMIRGYFPNNPETEDPPEHQLPQMNISDIKFYLELRQLGLGEGNYYTHVDPISMKDQEIYEQTQEIIAALKNNTDSITVTSVLNKPLPPASLQQFLRTGVTIPGVVLTDHQEEYKNKFYNSRYDLPSSVGIDSTWDNETVVVPLAEELNKVATTVAKALVDLAGGDSAGVTTDESMVNQLLYCYLVNANCTFFRSLQGTVDAVISPVGLNLYPGVDYSDTQSSKTANKLLAYFLGERTKIKEDEKEEKCKKPEDNNIYNYLYVLGDEMSEESGLCVKSTVHKTPAVSPAFIDDDHTSPDWASTKYSTWTESQWANTFTMRVFLVPSPQQEWVIFSLGALMVLISFPTVYFIRARADVIFKP